METGDLLQKVIKHDDLLSSLASGVADRRLLTEELSASRSTIYRAINELQDEGFVEKVEGVYTLSRTGSEIFTKYQQYCGITTSLLKIQQSPSILPSAQFFDSWMLHNADLIFPESYAPRKPLSHVEEMVSDSSSIRLFLPVLPPGTLECLSQQIEENQLDLSLLLGSASSSYLYTHHKIPFETILTRTNNFITLKDPPNIGLLLKESQPDTALIILYDENSNVSAVIRTNHSFTIKKTRRLFLNFSNQADSPTQG